MICLIPVKYFQRLTSKTSYAIKGYRIDPVLFMLRLTKKADYSLIALKHLASRHHGAAQDSVSAKEVADSYGVPLPLLSKILQKLTKAGLLISEHGTNGGYRLARDPRAITALEVIRTIDGPIILTECFTEHDHCDHTSRCPVRKPLRRIHEGILRLLAGVTIQDMLDDSDDGASPPPAPLIALSLINPAQVLSPAIRIRE
ncbi:MAG: SUF system Fe-S cluster assembly regulator [Bryobacteraceae bacterium]